MSGNPSVFIAVLKRANIKIKKERVRALFLFPGSFPIPIHQIKELKTVYKYNY